MENGLVVSSLKLNLVDRLKSIPVSLSFGFTLALGLPLQLSIPNKPLNYTVTPMNKIYTDKKTSLNDNNFYRIDPLFIDTLKNNPLVNDIYHQKNIDFNSAINI